MSTDRPVDGAHSDVVHAQAIPFVLVHLSCLAAIWTGVTWQTLTICAALYWLRIFAIGAGYHRYFSHKSYSTSRAFQFVLAFLSQTTAQNSVLWWASQHRRHHLYSDTENDTHSPVQRGFFYAHVGWIFDRKHQKADLVKVEDLARFPELRWLDRYELLSHTRAGKPFTGAGYTDINAVLPAKMILLAIALICAAAVFSAIVPRVVPWLMIFRAASSCDAAPMTRSCQYSRNTSPGTRTS